MRFIVATNVVASRLSEPEVQKVETVSGNLSIGSKTFCENTKVRHEKCYFMSVNVHKITHFLNIKVPLYNIKLNFIAFLGYHDINGWKICPFCKNTAIISFMLPPNCLIVRKCRRSSQKLSARAWFLKSFWQLGCQVATLFPSLVTHQKEVYYRHGIWHLNLTKFTNESQVTTSMDGHLLSLGWSPTNPRMVTNQKEVYYRLWILQLHITHKTNTRCHGRSPTIPMKVIR